jgi:hypothetical protein
VSPELVSAELAGLGLPELAAPPGGAGGGAAGAGTEVLSGWPEAKSKPQASQNCPVRAVPHWGQGSADPAGAGGAEGEEGSGADAGAAEAAGEAPLMRIPQLSQKSELALSWPAGQVGMAASLTSGSGQSWLTWYRAPSRRRHRPSS